MPSPISGVARGGGGRGLRQFGLCPKPRGGFTVRMLLLLGLLLRLGAPAPQSPLRPPRGLGWSRNSLRTYMIQSSQPVWSAASCQICLNPVWCVGCEGSRTRTVRG
ncbi:MAG: hypothetical protein GY696_10915 [Gammaproteobacteria bacterium]|nr:hypothetical protein [Gammaproteobacteria bacterium]